MIGRRDSDYLIVAKVDMLVEVIIKTLHKFPITEIEELEKKVQAEVVFKKALLLRLAKLNAMIESKGSHIFWENSTAAEFTVYLVLDIRKSKADDQFLWKEF